MKLPQAHHRKRNALVLSFAIPCVGMLLVMLCSQYTPFGQYSMLYSDMYHQYYPFFVAFRQALRSGTGLLYTWSTGLGMDYLGLIAYYLASPLNLLSVVVPEAVLLQFFSLLVPLKLGLAGLFFALFLNYTFQKQDVSLAIFSSFYGLCAWALGYQWNIMWLDTFALLPLVVMGTIKLLREKKFLLYTITLFLSIFSNYYIGFFTCIFVFLLFFVYQICRWQGWGRFFTDLFRIALFSAIAIGMTAVLTLPAVAALQNTQSSVNSFPTGFRLNMTTKHTLLGLVEAMAQVAGNMGGAIEPSFKEGLPNVYCGIASVMLLFLYLLAKDIKLRDKVCAVVLLLFFNASFVIRQLDYIWHGFHFTNMIPYRFSFLYSFVVLYMAYCAWIRRGDYKIWQILGAAGLSAGILACAKPLLDTQPLDLGSFTLDIPVYLIYNAAFLLGYLVIFLWGRSLSAKAEKTEAATLAAGSRRHLSLAFAGIMVLELIANLVCFGLYFTGTSVSNYPKGTDYTASVIRYMKEREKGDRFYRAETTHSQTLNDGALNNYYGVTTFTSSANVHVTEFMKALGFSAKNTYNRYLFEESSPVANLFLGLKYMIERDGRDRNSTYFQDVDHFANSVLLENQAYLPLGFLAQPELGELTFDASMNAFMFQNQLFTAATGVEGDVWHRISGDNLTITGNGVTIEDSNNTGYCRYTATENKSEVTYRYIADRDGFACVSLNLPKRNDYYISVNGAELFKETISLTQMMAIKDVLIGDVIEIRIVCDADEESTMNLSTAILNGELFAQGYRVLSASTWDPETFKTTFLEGRISCDRDGLLYTSIADNGNWTVKVDGEPAAITRVGDCMAAVALTQGEHTVSFTYHNPAFSLGWKLSLACAAVLVLLLWWDSRPKKKKTPTTYSRGGKFLEQSRRIPEEDAQ